MADDKSTDDDTDTDTSDDGKDKDSGKGSDDSSPAVKRALVKAHKEAEALRLKLKEIEDRDKSDLDKLKDRATLAEKRAEDAEAKILRLEVAAEKGLTMAQAKRLVGATREDLEADADELLESFGAAGGNGNGDGQQPRKAAPAGKPREKLRPGTTPDGGEPEPDMSKVADLVFKQARGGA
jgi:hypothetical protein